MRYSSNRAKITSDLKSMEDKVFKIEDNTLIRWLMQLYDCSFADAKDSITDARREIEESRQAELSEQVNKDDVVKDLVDNIDSKLEPEQEKILEVFKENE